MIQQLKEKIENFCISHRGWSDDYINSVKEINKDILDKLLKITAVPKEYECGFDYAWVSKQSWWNERYTERMKEIVNLISEESKKMSLKLVEPLLINKDLCYAMKK